MHLDNQKNLNTVNDNLKIDKTNWLKFIFLPSLFNLCDIPHGVTSHTKLLFRGKAQKPSQLAEAVVVRRWSAPAIVDRVLKYIPDLENEIETLKLKKQNYITQSEESAEISPAQNSQQITGSGTTVSVNEVKEGEAIIQICMENNNAFTKLLQKLEDEQGICIKSASTLHVSQTRFCYHLHIQTSENSILANYVEGLREKVISWLR
ncbi:transcription factor bHLH160-like [Olea europaea var. sylvestris]|uniref:transcription factor bHLH160-like n=1 Tax=Olea europaea var. sylvestris TaxID=158386 RepID=UPI000C1D742E|nr:transcription factor bHLH160-like [Olea europaea var. sylvestris]